MKNFFVQQETARRNTFRLVVLFVLGVLGLIALIYAAATAIFVFWDHPAGGPKPSLWQPIVLVAVSLGVGAVVGGASLYKVSQLSEGGKSVALLMGGDEIQQGTKDWREKRLLNIVEEMAIASGVPMPPVYIMRDEEGINAFAAGFSPGDAVVSVSAGCLDYLNRDELQGVVAHEFSHILNGDMRTNIRLMGMIHGLMFLSVIAYYMLNFTGNSYSSSDSRDKSRNQWFIFGIAIMILGAVGSFFGQLIQAAVSRQREFLADASAVQFTRNPMGIGGALKKIGGMSRGSRMKSAQSQEVNHMFFAEGISRLSEALASHPPLEVRIKRIDPQWDGEYPVVEKIPDPYQQAAPKPEHGEIPNMMPGMPSIPGMAPVPTPVIFGLAEPTAERVGALPEDAVLAAGALGVKFPPKLREAAQDAFSARGLVYCLLLDSELSVREKQMASLQGTVTPIDLEAVQKLEPFVRGLEEELRLPLMMIAVPALRQMSKSQFPPFRDAVKKLIDADGKLSLLEYSISSLLKLYLQQAFFPKDRPRVRYSTLSAVSSAVVEVLSMVANEGNADPQSAAKAFDAGIAALGEPDFPAMLLAEEDSTLAIFDNALKTLQQANIKLRQRIIDACTATVMADEKVTVREGELLRVICAHLECPMPPLNGYKLEGVQS